MTPIRESLVLPCLFLTVVLLGGLRLGNQVRLVPPPLIALVLGMLLVGALVRSRAVVPERLMRQQRKPLENLSGLVVLLTLFAASAQIFNLVTPDRGLLHLLVSVFFFVQLLTTLTAVHDRQSMLRGLAVLLGSAFVLRFIALESLYAPGRGLMKRVMTALLEGITLGSLEYEPAGTLTGYVAFAALLIYFIGLVLVGEAPRRTAIERVPAIRDVNGIVSTAVFLALCLGGALVLPACGSVERSSAAQTPTASTSREDRDALLAAARVWEPPAVAVGAAALGENPSTPWPFRASDEVTCTFVVAPVQGTTAKFNCQLPSGEIVKVKYGARNPELFAEVAATRLVAALGFPADSMYLVARVRCLGCPMFPFQALRCHTVLGNACFVGGLDPSGAVDFAPAVIEYRPARKTIETGTTRGWAWYELDRIDPASGGSPRAHVDALRLLAVLLSHWDNKSENQRLVCGAVGTACEPPLAMMQDLGATFGPAKIDLHNWKHAPVWTDPRRCIVSMEHLPFGGATFPARQIAEEGRTHLVGLLDQLAPAQMHDLFAGSGVAGFDGISGEGRDPDAWARVLAGKIREIRDAGPCPVSAWSTS
jgi:hypothetical protein